MMNLKPFFKNTKDTNRMFKIAYFGAIGQLSFWFILADFIFKDLKETDKTQSSLLKRSIYSSLSIANGFIFAGIAHSYCARRVSMINLNKRSIIFKTSNMFGKNLFTVPIQRVKIIDQKNGCFLLKVDGIKRSYILDKSGEFQDMMKFKQIFSI